MNVVTNLCWKISRFFECVAVWAAVIHACSCERVTTSRWNGDENWWKLCVHVIRHVDSGALTVLAQDDVGGLQVRRILYKPYIPSNIKPTTKLDSFWTNWVLLDCGQLPSRTMTRKYYGKCQLLEASFVCVQVSLISQGRRAQPARIYLFLQHFYYAYLEI